MTTVRGSDVTLLGLGRRHVLFLVAATAGVVLRVVVTRAYHPALIFPDTIAYLQHAKDLHLSVLRPTGYSVFLRGIESVTESLAVVAALQHVIGVGLAVACYLFLLRRELPRWAATLAVLPLLLDPLQLVLEHYILSDVLFEALVVGACLTLLWHRRPGLVAVVSVGVLVASAGLVRGAGAFLVAGFLVAILCLRLPWHRVVAFLVAAIIPLAAYAAVFQQQNGEFALVEAGPRFLYARLAPIMHCKHLEMPSYERALCPPEPVGKRKPSTWYMWGGRQSGQWGFEIPHGMTRVQVVKDFDKRVVRDQPVIFGRAALRDFARGFGVSRTYGVPGYPPEYWLFADHYWTADTFPQLSDRISAGDFGDVGADRGLAGVVTDYGRWVYAPGPLMALLLLVAGLATLGVGRAWRSGNRVATGLLLTTCLIPLGTAAALSGFSWRYQLVQIPLLPMAGALGIAALVRGRAPATPEPAAPLRLLDRAATLVSGPRSVERPWVPVPLAVLAGLLVAGLVAGGAVVSGWFAPTYAALVGLLAGGAVSVVLLVGWWRARAWQGKPQ